MKIKFLFSANQLIKTFLQTNPSTDFSTVVTLTLPATAKAFAS